MTDTIVRGRTRKVDLCDICRKPTKSGHRYCADHRDPRELPTGDEMLRWIEAQQCPLCADGRTFAMLANHTVKAHGVTGQDIRAAAGLTYDARICSPEFTEDHRERTKGNTARLANLALGHESGSGGPSRKTGARMRAYVRLARLHDADFKRLLREELDADTCNR